MMRLLLILLPILFCSRVLASDVFVSPDTVYACDTINVPMEKTQVVETFHLEFPFHTINDSIPSNNFKRKKRLAAILAFPFPFGLLGLHRVALGTKPYIPFVYIATVGGCFLILPILDFIAILSADEQTFRSFENNPKVFMWSK